MELMKYNDDIFKKFNPFGNENFLELSNSDRLSIISLIKQYSIGLRDRLNFDEDITFGLEIEFENAKRKVIEGELAELFSDGKYSVVDDRSLLNGGEINSPILVNNENTWRELSKVCEIVSKNAYVLDNVGGHIHIGMHVLGNNPKYWANFAKLWAAYENVIFRFLYGEYISPRSGIVEQAFPIARDFIGDFDKIIARKEDIISCYMLKLLDKAKVRKRCVNLTNISDTDAYNYDIVGNKNTIEFRSPNGTFDPVIWQNNVNLLVHLLLYAKSESFDEECLNRRIQQLIDNDILFNGDRYLEVKERKDISISDMFFYTNLSKYSYVYIEQAMELADLIFTNNLDKIYFLRQYIKSGLVSSRPFVKSDGFTRTRRMN